jgi:hypothetical protein
MFDMNIGRVNEVYERIIELIDGELDGLDDDHKIAVMVRLSLELDGRMEEVEEDKENANA